MIWKCAPGDIPGKISKIDGAPQQLFIRAANQSAFDQLMARPRIAIVGTRRVTSYGDTVTARLAGELAAYGIVVVSGLALGTDSIAHRAALEAGGLTMAVLPGPVEDVYPRSHHSLAGKIVDHYGALVSEYPAGTPAYVTNFVARNRLVTALSDVLLITEASENSGTMHTARFAIDQGMPVLAIPGNIDSPASAGTNNLLKSNRAAPITCAADILEYLNVPREASMSQRRLRVRGNNPTEQTILDLIEQGIYDGGELLARSQLDVTVYNSCLTMLEITAKIRPRGGNQWVLA